MNEKIGMYTEDEILEYMTDCEGPFLGRSMYDAIFGKIDKLQQENTQLKQQLKEKDEKISKVNIKLKNIKQKYNLMALTTTGKIYDLAYTIHEDLINILDIIKENNNE